MTDKERIATLTKALTVCADQLQEMGLDDLAMMAHNALFTDTGCEGCGESRIDYLLIETEYTECGSCGARY